MAAQPVTLCSLSAPRSTHISAQPSNDPLQGAVDPPFHLAMTCSYLASKLGENTRCFDRVLALRRRRRREHQATKGAVFSSSSSARLMVPRVEGDAVRAPVLAALCFRCAVASAHKFVQVLRSDLHRVPLVVRLDRLEAAAAVFESLARCELLNVAADKQALHRVAREILRVPRAKDRRRGGDGERGGAQAGAVDVGAAGQGCGGYSGREGQGARAGARSQETATQARSLLRKASAGRTEAKEERSQG